MDFQVYMDENGEYRWRALDAQGKLVVLPKAPRTARGEGARRAFRNVQSALGRIYDQQAG